MVGIVANPASGRDIRRLISQASVFQISEKCGMVLRVLAGISSVGVRRAFMMPDASGLGARVQRSLDSTPPAGGWPEVAFLEIPIEDGPSDTSRAVEAMVEKGVGAIVVLGGDGTNRAATMSSGEVPLVPLSTGTNNVFPRTHEATIAGMAAGLVAGGRVSRADSTIRNKVLRIEVNGLERDLAVVEATICSERWIGSGAIWRPDSFRELYVAFAEPDAIGPSSIAGLVHPASRSEPFGLKIELKPNLTDGQVMAPIAPGLLAMFHLGKIEKLFPGQAHAITTTEGVIALDGERAIEFSGRDRIAIRLDLDGPMTIDIRRVMQKAAEDGLLRIH